MSDLLREQLSAFMDGELPSEECALLLKRVANNDELNASWHHWHLIGDTLRGELTDEQTQRLAQRVNQALDASESSTAAPSSPPPFTRRHGETHSRRPRHWYRRRTTAIAASVAVLGVAGLVGALVSQQVGGGQVLVPAASHGGQSGTSIRHVNLQQAPQPVRSELNRYLMMHEVYGPRVMPSAHADSARGAATSAANTRLLNGTDGS
jgi:anti-sigma factor RsiW